MLIGIDASRANRSHKSGTEWYAYYIIRWLAKLDSKNQYILYTDKQLTGGLLDLTSKQYFISDKQSQDIKYEKNGSKKVISPYNNFKCRLLRWPFKYLWTQARLSLEMIVKRPDVLFVPSHTLPLYHPKNSIVTIHDIGFKKNIALYRREDIGPEVKPLKMFLNFFVRIFTLGKYGANATDYLYWSTKFALKHAKIITTVSQFTKHEIEKFYNADSRKIEVIHNGYNKYIYKKITDKNKTIETLVKYGIEQPYLLYVGRLDKKKNISSLVEAYAIMKEKNKKIAEKLVLAGDAYYGYDEINYMINEFGLENDVIMPGWIEEEDLPYLYGSASAFVFPSHYEGFGIPLLQAMACEVPIAASWSSSIPEVAGRAALLFDPNNVRSMAQALEEIITSEKLRSNLVNLGRERVKKFSWEETAKNILKIINKLEK